MAAAGFWEDQEQARAVVAELKSVSAILKPLDEVASSSEDLEALLEMADEDEGLADELRDELRRLEEKLEQLELKSLLDGPHDGCGALLTINARDGGTDANDWADMLLRMYTQWAQGNDFSIELLDRQENDEAGINNATLAVRGPMAYGFLKGETGMHRLVRISPFNSEGKRQTSFAAVDVAPEVSDEITIEIDEADIREDTFRASGAGGQHVNTTDSAVRITHLPTGIVVQCQNERSQHKNRATAWAMLRARLYEAELQRREEQAQAEAAAKSEIGWGHQIRSYVLQPYQMVKDLRTGVESSNPNAVLDGDLDQFIEAALAQRVEGGTSAQIEDLD